MNRAVGLDAAGLDATAPFHLAVDRAGIIVQAGRSLHRLMPGLVGHPATVLFQVLEPADLGDGGLEHAAGRLMILASRSLSGLVLKGQSVATGDGGLFIGTPQVRSATQLTALGLHLGDFAVHDSVIDLLLLLQAQSASLAEAERLANRLAELNRELEARVDSRTRSLSEQTAALERANKALQAEAENRKRAEAELNVSHQMEAVGQLAAGIAHEINTPIQFVGDNLRFLVDAFTDLSELVDTLQQAAPDAAVEAVAKADLPYLCKEVPEALRQSLEGIDRVASLVRAMKEFSHPDSGERKPADLNRMVETTIAVARNEYKYVADIEVRLDPDLPQPPCVVGEIGQALLNLVVNAAHAIGDAVAAGRPRGQIVICTSADDGWVEVSVRDTGTGIPEAVRPRIFDPFFTTKPVGKGTGQGLYLVHTLIVKKHQGSVTFTTEMGVGTTFCIRLPLRPTPPTRGGQP